MLRRKMKRRQSGAPVAAGQARAPRAPAFAFRNPGRLVDGDLELVLVKMTPADPATGHVPAYAFEMRHPGEATALGTIHLRVGSAAALRYPGHLGYEVKPEHRGHRYAARSCVLLAPLARAHGLRELWLTVAPTNVPSQRTCARLGARYVETVRLPKDHEMYAQGARYRRRYRFVLTTGAAVRSALPAKRPSA